MEEDSAESCAFVLKPGNLDEWPGIQLLISSSSTKRHRSSWLPFVLPSPSAKKGKENVSLDADT